SVACVGAYCSALAHTLSGATPLKHWSLVIPQTGSLPLARFLRSSLVLPSWLLSGPATLTLAGSAYPLSSSKNGTDCLRAFRLLPERTKGRSSCARSPCGPWKHLPLAACFTHSEPGFPCRKPSCC